MTVEAFAPAKINLTLHVTGQRADGFHLLDSLVVFADVGDRITVDLAEEMSLVVAGPNAQGVPTDSRNLILKAAAMFGVNARFSLEKHLPAAAGIGGGSSDAAAAIRALQSMTGQFFSSEKALELGADVPVCLEAQAATMTGIGESVVPVHGLPELPAVLVNPRIGVATPAVFQALESKTNPAMQDLPTTGDLHEFCDWLAQQRNDLEPPARQIEPKINDVISALDGALIARMSGSGATCFGVYPDQDTARIAAKDIGDAHPDWWVTATVLK